MTEPDAAASPADAATTTPACQNCGAPLLGPHCYRCGQPVNGLVRHFSSIIGDFADSVLNIDARVFRTLWPLFARPGYLSREYFAGRRVRYVSPVRLFVFLSIVTFFVAQLVVSFSDDAIRFDGGDDSARVAAQAGETGNGTADADAGADDRTDDFNDLEFNGRPWNRETNPVDIAWVPAFADRWINAQIGKGVHNVAALKKDPERFKEAFVGALPSTLFVLLPIFALMLKFLYVFKRRLYMEHLIVALHSHAFMCLSVLLVFAVSALGDAVAWLGRPMGIIEFGLFAWMPLYLLLMQKRVYGQGWLLTTLKFGVLGICYMVLLSLGMAATVVASVIWL
jgi:hypothetical protein